MRLRTWIIVVLVILLIGGGAGYYFWYRPMNRNGNGGTREARTVPVTRGDVVNSITVYGEVVPNQEYTYTFSGNEVEDILVSEGERVEEGDDLVELDSGQQRLNLLQAEQALEEARAEGIEAEIERRELEYRIAQEELRETTLTARFSGVVTEINQATASSESWSLVLVDTSQLYIRAEVNQLDAPSLSEGKEAEATIEPLPGESWDVELVKIGGMALSRGNSKVVEVKAKLPQVDEPILTGYTSKLNITTSSARDVLRAPISSLVETESGWLVMKSTLEGISRQPVGVGVTSDQYAEITDGLEQGDEILLNPTGRGAAQLGPGGRTAPPGGGGGFPGGSP